MKNKVAAPPIIGVVEDDKVHEIINNIRKAAEANVPITIDPKDALYVRKSFLTAIREGEQRLHEFAQVILQTFAPQEEIESKLMVFGRCSNPGHEGLLRSDTVFDYRDQKFLRQSDASMAKKNAPYCSICGEKSQSIASFIQYKPMYPYHSTCLQFLRTRIKSTSHIAYKIADIVFGIDTMVHRDKIINHLSHSIMDVYGMKLIVNHQEEISGVVEKIKSIEHSEILEVKDYLGPNRKKSGFEALKIVNKYKMQIIEIQIQAKAMFDTERQNYVANHQTYKEKQMEQRRKLGKEYTILYEALHKMFSKQELSNQESIEVVLSGKGTDDEF